MNTSRVLVMYGGARRDARVSVRLPSGRRFNCVMRTRRPNKTIADMESDLLEAMRQGIASGHNRPSLLHGGYIHEMDVPLGMVQKMEALCAE